MSDRPQRRRRNLLRGLALGTLGLPFAIRAFAGKNLERDTSSVHIQTRRHYQWTMVTTWPPKFPVLGEGCQLMADWVREMSEGRLDIKVFGGGELVPALQAFDTVQKGAAEMGSGASYYWAGKIPAAQFFATVPFGLNAQQMNAWILSAGGLELWESLYADFNLIPIPGGNTGVQMGGWFNREIRSIEDLRGLKIRMPGLGGKVLERAGATPVLLAGSEIYTGLERGVIDATEWIGPYHDYLMGFHEIARYYYAPGWHEPGAMLECFINQKAWNSLPPDLQAILRTAILRMNNWVLTTFELRNNRYLKKLVEEEGVEVRLFPGEVLESLRSHTQSTLEEIASRDAAFEKVLRAYQQFQKDATRWSGVTEKQFYNRLQG